LSELADYRKIHGTAMFLKLQQKTPSWVGQTKEQYKLHLAGKEIAYDHFPYSGIGRLGF
jgi:hypothetical protein